METPADQPLKFSTHQEYFLNASTYVKTIQLSFDFDDQESIEFTSKLISAAQVYIDYEHECGPQESLEDFMSVIDPVAWEKAMHERTGITSGGKAGLLFHTLTSDTATIEKVILDLGVDDDLGR